MTAQETWREEWHSRDCPVSVAAFPRVRLFGVQVDALTMEETLAAVRAFVRCGRSHQHVCLNAAKVVELERHPDLAAAIQDCDLVSVDGQAVVWASRALGAAVPERVAGIDLFESLLGEASEKGWGVYLLGSRQEVVEAVRERALAEHPSLRVAGACGGYWTEEEEPSVVADVAASGADLLFVALPSPRKEIFLERYGRQLGVPFRMGVGGSFDVYAGVTRRAPRWVQRLGLEWFYRFLQEPRRMFKRYLFGNTSFVLLTAREWRSLRRARRAPARVRTEAL